MKHLLSLVILTGALAQYAGASVRDLEVSPGSLGSYLRSEETDTCRLAIHGSIDARDLSHLAAAAADTLDLSDVRIVSYISSKPLFFGERRFAADALPEGAFAGSRFSTVILPQGLRSIAGHAFAGSEIVTVQLPAGLESIGAGAFAHCRKLEKITLPATLVQLGEYAFAGAVALTEADLSATPLSGLPAHTFDGCTSLSSLSLPGNLRSIGELAIAGTALSEISSALPVKGAPFALALALQLESASLTLAEPNAEGSFFGDRSLMRLSSSSPEIAPAMYAYCPSLSPTAILEKTTRVGNYAFAGTDSPYILLSENVTTLGDGIFAGDTYLETIDARPLGGNIPAITEHTFDGLSCPGITLIVMADYLTDWSSAPGWKEFNVVGTKGLDDIAADGYSVTCSGGCVTVKSDVLLREVAVYGTDGSLLAAAAPDACEVSLNLRSSENIIVVTSRNDAGKTRTDKIIIR